jgi:hypothetical protein
MSSEVCNVGRSLLHKVVFDQLSVLNLAIQFKVQQSQLFACCLSAHSKSFFSLLFTCLASSRGLQSVMRRNSVKKSKKTTKKSINLHNQLPDLMSRLYATTAGAASKMAFMDSPALISMS